MFELNDYVQRAKDILATAYNNKFKLLFYNVMVFAFAVVIIFFWPRGYRSEAKIWLKVGRENSRIDPTATTGDTISIQDADREDEIKSVLDVLSGRGLATQVVEELTPGVVLGDVPLHPGDEEESSNTIVDLLKGALGSTLGLLKQIDPVSEKEEAVLEVVETLKVGAERKSNVISIEYDAKTPELAQAIVKAVIDRYRLEHTRIHQTEGSKFFFDEQRTELQERVQHCAERLQSEKEALGLATIEGQRAILEAQLLAVRTEKLSTVQKIEEAKARKLELAKQLQQQPAFIQSEERVVPNTGRDQLEAQLYSLQVQRMALEAKMSNSNPRLQAIKEQEKEARRQLEDQSTNDRSEVTQALNAVHQQLKVELVQVNSGLAGFQALLSALEQQEEDLLAEVNTLNAAEINIRALERELSLAEKSLTSYSESLEEARIDEALNRSDISNISVAQFPTLQEKPVSPSKMIVALLGIFAMGCGSVAIVTGMYLIGLQRSVSRVSQVAPSEPEGLPRVITVPHQRRYRSVPQT